MMTDLYEPLQGRERVRQILTARKVLILILLLIIIKMMLLI
jgi:hypothetical protein